MKAWMLGIVMFYLLPPAIIAWYQGIVSSSRFYFWWQLLAIALHKPYLLYDYLVALSFGEHFFSFCHEVKLELETQLEIFKQHQQAK